MKNYKKIGLGLSLVSLAVSAIILNHGPALAAPVGFNGPQIQAASGFAFKTGTDGNTITAQINGKSVEFDYYGGPASGSTSMASLASLAGKGGYNEWKVNPSDAFCTPNSFGTNNPAFHNEIVIQHSDLKANGSVLTSATGTLFGFAGISNASCTSSPTAQNGYTSTKGVSVPTGSATGAVFTQQSLNTAVYKFSGNGSVIQGTFKLADGSTKIETFTDQQPYDTVRNFAADNSGDFCDAGGSTPNLNFNDGAQDNQTITMTKVEIPIVANASGSCKLGNPAAGSQGTKLDNSGLLAEKVLDWSGSSIISFGTKSVLNLKADTQAAPATSSYNGMLYDSNPGQCSGWAVLLTKAPTSSGGDNGTLYHLSSTSDVSKTAVKNLFNGCTANPAGGKAVTLADAVGANAQVDGASNNVLTPCEAHSGGFVFAWAMCPILEAANTLTTVLVNSFESQLNFNVSQLGTSTDASSGNYKIHQSWSILKDIASALVVIVMLIMVLSQAASFGPFDAYTIRKLLPRLVAAVILMQISWALFNFVIQMVNDLANGLAAIMYLPFGGASQMDLWHLLYNAKLSDVLLGAMDWGALAVFLVLGWAFLFTILGFALTGVVALLFGLLALVFRKILIILLLIFAPLALLAWVLPGTKQYWDMWWKNFIKVLFMFPIIVAIIAAGRIFAYVVGTQDNGQFLNLIFIMVGFFGPLFLLPKTYKWGGQAMQMAGNGVMKASSKVSEKPRDFLKHRQQEYGAYRQAQSAQRVYKDPKHRGSILRLDPFKSGRWDPTLRVGAGSSERRNETLAKYVERGKKAQGEEVAAYSSLIGAETESMNRSQALNHLKNRFDSSHEAAEKHAIAQKMIQLQGFDEVENIRQQLFAAGEYSTWNSIVNSNYDALKGMSPHFTNGFDSNNLPASLDQLDAGKFMSMKDEELAVMSEQGWQHFEQVNGAGFRQTVSRIGANSSLSGRLAPHARNAYMSMQGGIPAQAVAAAGNVAVPPVVGPAVAPGAAPGGGPAPGPVAVTRPAPGQGAFIPNGELNISHTSPEGRIITANSTDIDNYVTSSGGWNSLSDGDLMNIYHFRTGQHKADAARELRSRNLL